MKGKAVAHSEEPKRIWIGSKALWKSSQALHYPRYKGLGRWQAGISSILITTKIKRNHRVLADNSLMLISPKLKMTFAELYDEWNAVRF